MRFYYKIGSCDQRGVDLLVSRHTRRSYRSFRWRT